MKASYSMPELQAGISDVRYDCLDLRHVYLLESVIDDGELDDEQAIRRSQLVIFSLLAVRNQCNLGGVLEVLLGTLKELEARVDCAD